MSIPDPLSSDARAHLRTQLHHRREQLIARLHRRDLSALETDDTLEAVDRIDSAMAGLDEPTPGCCVWCAQPIALTRRTLIPHATLCTACALMGEGRRRGERSGPSSIWGEELLAELG
ncbi:MAG: hypothetical protein GXD23_00465 [Comamonadaceae bacterium]|jgi:hypothetical protein|uniref:Uncharacterized protein n=1 Tax=Hydrogenophaga borbori TaxID=2294117 RepID=A0A372EPL1_9BURK|nr:MULTISPECIES: hypothetical protein [Hydrogenophaga]NCT95815.1 hypothetical protein [Comamonadaceae bacterium]RFP82535.1 hypothetical protein DY262_01510 [Hydrogenophaga borbori]WQB82111.1 hypothetical protein SOM08_13975 [Hydrogenophaga sp. SNF1]